MFEWEAEPLSPNTEAVWITTECECLSGEFFGPLCWIMTEWERSHRDKRERERGEEREADEGRGKGGLKWCYLWASVVIAREGSFGLCFNTMADNNRADGQMVMYLHKDFCLCVCMHECVSRAGGHVYEVFQYSEAVRFLKDGRSSTETKGKSEKYEPPFKIKCKSLSYLSSLQLLWHLFCCIHLSVSATASSVFHHFTPLFLFIPAFLILTFTLLSLTSRPLVAYLSIFHPWVPLKLENSQL